MPVTSTELFNLLAPVLGLPEACVWVELRMARDEMATVRCEFFPDARFAETLVARYELVRLEGGGPKPKFQLSARVGCSDDVRDDFNAWLLERFGYGGTAV